MRSEDGHEQGPEEIASVVSTLHGLPPNVEHIHLVVSQTTSGRDISATRA